MKSVCRTVSIRHPLPLVVATALVLAMSLGCGPDQSDSITQARAELCRSTYKIEPTGSVPSSHQVILSARWNRVRRRWRWIAVSEYHCTRRQTVQQGCTEPRRLGSRRSGHRQPRRFRSSANSPVQEHIPPFQQGLFASFLAAGKCPDSLAPTNLPHRWRSQVGRQSRNSVY